MLQPKKTKFRRMQKGRMKGLAQRGNQLAYGSFAIKALESSWITGRQIEAARQAITRYMKREGQLWIRIFPDKPITKKPAEVRMGKGKGNPEGFVAPERRDVFSSRRKVCLWQWRRRRCVWVHRSFPLRPSLLYDVITLKPLSNRTTR